MTPQFVFLDTSFLVSFQTQNHSFYERSLSIISGFQANVTPVAHSLVFDEFWYVLLGMWKKNLYVESGVDFHKKLALVTENIFNIKEFKFLKTAFLKEDLLKTIDIMRKYKLRPRDAMIVSIMKKEGIKKIASFDTDFDGISGITRLH